MKKSLYTLFYCLLILGSTDMIAQSQSTLDQGMRYVEENAPQWGLQESDYKGALVSDMYTNNKTGITYIYLVQAYKDIPVLNAITSIVIAPDGKIMSTGHRFISNIKSKISTTTPSLAPKAAIKAAVSHLGLKAESMPTLKKSNSEKNIHEFGKADLCHNEINVKLTYVLDNGSLKLAWSLAIDEKEDSDYYNTFVDATTGQVITKHNYTKSCVFHKGQYAKHKGCNHDHGTKEPMATFKEASVATNSAAGSYNVFALPTESPIHGEQVTVTDPHFTDASPFGWHDTNGAEGAETTITRGNNVHAFLDKSDSNFSSGDEPDGGEGLAFDFAYDADNESEGNEEAATVNLFYMNNMMHDITKRLGFDEAAGNFQINNYGNGGTGGDQVLAKSSAGSEAVDANGDPAPLLNNADFGTPPDGSNGQMRMFLWTNPSGLSTINEPEELAGILPDVGEANFGAPVPTEAQPAVTGKIALATDGVPGEGTTVCNPVSNGTDISGNIAMVDRGLCDFVDKAYYSQEAGAIGVIICNVVGGGGTDGLSSFGMGSNPNNPFLNDVIVPVISLGKTDCDRIKAAILSDIDVRISIQSSPAIGPERLDGSFDNGIIAHEYGHGISNRLIGGPSAANCLTTDEQAGEGISDYFSLITTVEEGDTGADSRGIGNFATAAGVNGRGIRSYPYSTDMNINPSVYDDVKGTTSIYLLGEVWTAALWEVYWGMVDAFGLDTTWEDEESGNYKAARLTIEGMKASPCNPSLIEARNSILAMDSILYDGEHAAILWTAFAKRGFGYLATDGGSSTDRSDGTQNFEPYPLAIKSMKIQETVSGIVNPGDEVTVTITAQNHIPETQTGVVITSIIPSELEYIEGSSSIPGTFDNGVLTIPVGDMEYEAELEMTYKAIAKNDAKSTTLFYDDVDSGESDEYQFDAIESFTLWTESDGIANSGEISWWASQIDTELEIDYWMNITPLQVTGNKPVLRFYHRYETQTGFDGGFVQVSNDGGITYQDIKDKFIRNGYPVGIDYSTFAIPQLDGFSGTTDEKFIDSYIDLSDYKGDEVIVRFRFGTNETGGPASEERGWYVDDLELIDLVTYEAVACINSENSDEEQCSNPVQIIVNSDRTVGTNDDQLQGFNISVSPNPASEYVTIAVSADQKTPVLLSLTSIDGRVISTQALIAQQSNSVRTFDTSNLNSGMYLIQIKSEKGLTTKKIVIN